MFACLSGHCISSVQIRSFFWSVFSRIRNEYGDLRSKSPYSVRMRENTDQNFSRSESVDKYLKLIKTGFYVKCFRADFLQFLTKPSKFHFEWHAVYLLLISSFPGSLLKFPNSLRRLMWLILN